MVISPKIFPGSQFFNTMIFFSLSCFVYSVILYFSLFSILIWTCMASTPSYSKESTNLPPILQCTPPLICFASSFAWRPLFLALAETRCVFHSVHQFHLSLLNLACHLSTLFFSPLNLWTWIIFLPKQPQLQDKQSQPTTFFFVWKLSSASNWPCCPSLKFYHMCPHYLKQWQTSNLCSSTVISVLFPMLFHNNS